MNFTHYKGFNTGNINNIKLNDRVILRPDFMKSNLEEPAVSQSNLEEPSVSQSSSQSETTFRYKIIEKELKLESKNYEILLLQKDKEIERLKIQLEELRKFYINS